jgi:tetratricopeptide (TPR) repeat protein
MADAGRSDAGGAARRLVPALALVGITTLAYGPAFRAGFVWDDDVHVTRNEAIRSWRGLADIWRTPGTIVQYYPLTHTIWWVQYHLWGVAPRGYHGVNVLLHGVNAILVWLVLRRLRVPGAWIAAAVFALHPVHVESVAWVSELKNVQSGFFYLLALLAALRWLHPEEEDTPASTCMYALSLLCFVAAVLSKSVTITLPVVLALLLWWRNGRLERGQVVALVPLAAVCVPAAALTVWMEHHYVGAIGDEWALSLPGRFLVAGRAPWFYAAKLAWPSRLSFVYPRWTIDPSAWSQWLFPLAGLATLAALIALRHRLGRAPLAAALCFVVTLGPALGFVDVYPMRYSFVADHFQYLASIAPIALLVAGGTLAMRRLHRATGRALAAALLGALGVLAWQRAAVFETAEALWRDTLAKNPSAWMAHNNLGLQLQAEQRLNEAAEHYREAMRLRPNYPEAIYNLGNVLAAEGRLSEAEAQYEAALGLDDRFAAVHNNLGNILVMQGRIDDGKRQYRRAIELDPDYAEARRNLSIAEQWRGRMPPAAQ